MILKNKKDAVCDLFNECMKHGKRLCGKKLPCAVETDMDGVLIRELYIDFEKKELYDIDVNEKYL